jgi:hypothetical protein
VRFETDVTRATVRRKRRRTVAAGVFVGATFLATSRAAKSESPPNDGERRHDGFFARSEPGVALFFAFIADSGPKPRRTAVRGIGQSGAISVGGTPAAGLVVGGTAWAARIDPSFVEGGTHVTPDDDSVKLSALRLGPFVDWYPEPNGGFHAFASVAFTTLVESDVKGNPIRPPALGASLGAGFGYEWFVSSELSLGFFTRQASGYAVRHAPLGSVRSLFFALELGVTATYH